jgi:hypothetical protein
MRSVLLSALLCAVPCGSLLAQARAGVAPALAAGTAPSVAATYDERLAELRGIDDSASAVAEVANLTLTRDVGRLTLESGRLYVLPRVGGRVVAVAFKGRGTFRFAPTERGETVRITRAFKAPALETPFTELVLLFSDSTFAELGRGVTFAPSRALPRELASRTREMLDYMSDNDAKQPDADVMVDLLNGAAGDGFYAHVARERGEPVMFMVDPYEVEAVRLAGRAHHVGWTRTTEVISQTRRQADTLPVQAERRGQASVERYALHVALPRSAAGDVSFSASATLDLTATEAVGPWIALSLYEKLQVDSARWGDGTAAVVYKAKDAGALWVNLGAPLAAGAKRTLTVYYHGDLIDRYADFFFIKSSIAWYPVSTAGREHAMFDLTFDTPRSFLFASVGERVDSTDLPNRMMRTRWVTSAPIRNASFNLGLFQGFDTKGDSLPPVTVFYADQARRAGFLPKALAKEQVGEDVQNALKFFRYTFGEVPVRRFYATEIPYEHGEAFPGLVHLSASTFLSTENDGFDEFFRAHEVAHQWWGIAVDYATYHDQWLSEGVSSFAGLWYLQTARKDNKRYFGLLDRWRTDIMRRRSDPEPISLGVRVASPDDASDYNVIVYQKSAWVMHMLRMLMIDLRTMNEDRFTATMRDFYGEYRGKRASTDDFRRVAERHLGVPLDWFFDQWIYRGEIPTYRWAWKNEPAEGGKFRVRLRVRQEGVPESFQMYVPVTVDLGNNALMRLRVKVKGPVTETELPLLPSAPKAIRFNDLSGVLAEVKDESW